MSVLVCGFSEQPRAYLLGVLVFSRPQIETCKISDASRETGSSEYGGDNSDTVRACGKQRHSIIFVRSESRRRVGVAKCILRTTTPKHRYHMFRVQPIAYPGF
jgi:hypothetical protein